MLLYLVDLVGQFSVYVFSCLQIRIQLLDLPGIIEGAAYGKGRGREVIAVARSCDMILVVLDGKKRLLFLLYALETVN